MIIKTKEVLDKYQKIINILPGFLLLLNREGTILFGNKQSRSILQSFEGKLTGQNIWEISSELLKTSFKENFDNFFKDKKDFYFELFLESVHKWYSIYFKKSKSNVLVFGQDISEFKRILNSIFDYIPAGIAIAESSTGNLVFSNKQFKRLIDEHSIFMHLDGKRYKSEDRPLNRSIKGEIIKGEEIRILRSDHQETIVKARSAPIKSHGRTIAAIAIYTDSTAYKKIENELSQKKREFETLVENTPDIIVRFDKNLNYTYVNPAVSQITGISVDKIINNNINNLRIFDIKDSYIKNVFNYGRSQEVEFNLIDENKSSRNYSAKIVPEFNERELINSVLLVATDITQLKEMDKRKDEFINMVSHELKTPLTTIKIYNDILKSNIEKGYSADLQLLIKVDRQINKLNSIIKDLLAIPAIQSELANLNKIEFSISGLVYKTVNDVLANNKSHQINIKNNSTQMVYADKNQIYQVLTNLILNAIKYSPKHSSVEINIKENHSDVVVSVQDYGVGIKKEHHKKIFERFYRVFDATDVTYPGLGIGLYLSSEIIKNHGGRMSVLSSKGFGSIFSFTLPIINSTTTNKQ